jgi:hypothetical protein
MDHDQSGETRARQWHRWEECIGEYCGRANFQAAWRRSGGSFDADFQGYVNARLKNSPALATPGPDAGSAQILTGCDPARSVLQPRRPGVACAAAALIETPIPRMMSGPKR